MCGGVYKEYSPNTICKHDSTDKGTRLSSALYGFQNKRFVILKTRISTNIYSSRYLKADLISDLGPIVSSNHLVGHVMTLGQRGNQTVSDIAGSSEFYSYVHSIIGCKHFISRRCHM